MATTWILVANRSDARLFEHREGKPLKRLRHIPHPASRMDNRELESDRPGSVFQAVGHGMHPMTRQEDPKEREAANFSRQLAEMLHKERTVGHFDRLWIIAAPEFLGMLRQDLDAPTQKLIAGTLNRDLSYQDDSTVERHLAEAMRKGEIQPGH